MSLFNILVDIQANTAQFVSSMERAEERIKHFGEMVTRVGEVLLGAELAEFVEHTIDAGAAMERAAVRAGVAGQDFSELAYAAKQGGVGTDELSAAMVKMNKAISEAGTGAQKPTEALAALGLTFSQLKALKPDEQLEVIADRISKLQSPADRSRAEIALFGRAGAELGPMFEQGAAGIRKMREEAQGLGASFSDETLKKMEETHQSIERMKTSFSALATVLTAEVAPALGRFFDDIAANLSGNKAHFAEGNIKRIESVLDSLDPNKANLYARTRAMTELWKQEAIKMQADMAKELKFENPDLNALLGEPKAPPGFQAAMQKLHEVIVAHHHESLDKMEEFYRKLDELTETDVEKTTSAYYRKKSALDMLLKDQLIDAQEYQKRLAYILDQALPGIDVTAKKIYEKVKRSHEELEVFADQAARNMQSSFANFLFDPFKDGVSGMVSGFLTALRRMIAEAAAANIMDAIFGSTGKKGGGLGGLLGTFIGWMGGGHGVASAAAGSAFGSDGMAFATGGSFTVGGSGSTDSQLVRFMATPGERVTVDTPGSSSSGASLHFAPVYHISAPGADQNVLAMLPALLARSAEQTKRDILMAWDRSGLKRPAYA